jgi:hypothetical protein
MGFANEQLLKNYCPIMKFHPDEKYFPCTIEYYLKNSKLLLNGMVIKNYNQITPKNLPEIQKNYSQQLTLSVKNTAWVGQKQLLDQIPLYGTVSVTKDITLIQYIFFYAYNGSFNVAGNYIGEHQCDIERISVEICNKTNQIKRIYYGAHQHTDGLWVSKKNIPFENGKIVVYIAKHSHATYPKAKTWWRIFGFANDHTSNKGISWFPSKVEYITNTTNWNTFTGFMGFPNDCPTPLHHLWWHKENGVSANFFERIFRCS